MIILLLGRLAWISQQEQMDARDFLVRGSLPKEIPQRVRGGAYSE
jgi:hypothetical protein